MAVYDNGTYNGIYEEDSTSDVTIVTASATQSITLYSITLTSDTVGLHTVTWGASSGAKYIWAFEVGAGNLGLGFEVDLTAATAIGAYGEDVIVKGTGTVNGTVVYSLRTHTS